MKQPRRPAVAPESGQLAPVSAMAKREPQPANPTRTAPGWLASTSATPIRMHRQTSTSDSLLQVVHSTSPAPAAPRARVAGGAEEPLLARHIRSRKRRRQDAYAAPRRRRTRTRSRRLSLRLRQRLCSPARTPRCRSSSRPAATISSTSASRERTSRSTARAAERSRWLTKRALTPSTLRPAVGPGSDGRPGWSSLRLQRPWHRCRQHARTGSTDTPQRFRYIAAAEPVRTHRDARRR